MLHGSAEPCAPISQAHFQQSTALLHTTLEAHVIQTFASAQSQIITGQEPSAKAVWMVFMNVNLES